MPAVRCWPWEVFSSWLASRDLGTARSSYLAWVGLVAGAMEPGVHTMSDKQRVLMHGHQGWNVRHGLCHIYMRYVYIYEFFIAFVFLCLFITVTWWYVWCFEWASGDQEEVQACLVTLWLFIISCYSLYKTTTNPHFHKYSMDFHLLCVYLNYFFMRNMTEVTIPW